MSHGFASIGPARRTVMAALVAAPALCVLAL